MPYKKPPTVEERDALVNLFMVDAVLDETLSTLGGHLSDEEKTAFGAAAQVVGSSAYLIRDRFPENIVRALIEKTKRCEIRYIPRNMGVQDNYMCMSESDFVELVKAAYNAECTICMKEGKDVKKCPLRRIWRDYTATVKDMQKGLCGYAGLGALEDDDA